MIENYVKTIYQHICVTPIANRLKDNVTPNQMTCLAGFFGVLVLPCLYLGYKGLAILWILTSGYLDSLDGVLARLTEKTSTWGTVLDITMDRWVEFLILVALWSVAPLERSLYVILMMGSIFLCVTSFLVVGIFTENESEKGFHYSPGIIERAEAFAFFIAMIVWPGYFVALSLCFSGLVMLTTFIRLREFYQHCRLGRFDST